MVRAKKKTKISKSNAIREVLKTIDSPKDAAKKLASRGIKVTPAYVSAIKTADKKKSKSSKGTVDKSRSTSRDANGFDVGQASELMNHAMALIDAVGREKSRELVDAADDIAARFR